MQSLTQPELLLKPFAESGDKNTLPVTNTDASNPQLADLTNGFPQITSEDPDDGGLPPERKDFNGLGYLTTTYDYFAQAGGTYTFSPTISSAIGGYPQGARLWYTDGNGDSVILRSAIANNTYNFNTNSSYIGNQWVPETPALSWNNFWTGNNVFYGQNTFWPLQKIKCSNVNGLIFQPSSPSGNNSVSFINNGTHFYMIPCNADGEITNLRPFYFDVDGSAAYVPASDRINSVLVTSAISKADNGYVKLGNGIIIQWGYKSGTANVFNTVTLPTAFTSTNYKVVATGRSSNPDYSDWNTVISGTKTTTTFQVSWDDNDSGVEWIAIGY